MTRRNAPTRRIAYFMSRFPKLTETFILYEIVELERQGLQVEIFPLVREHEAVAHPEARALATRAQTRSPLSLEVLAAQVYWLVRSPMTYLSCWLRAILGNLGSPAFCLRALVVVPLAAWFARRIGELGVEHIHAHWATHPTLAAYVASRLSGRPYSFTVHAHDLYVNRTMLKTKLRQACFVVTIAEYNRAFLQTLYGPLAAKVRVIRCGVDLAVFTPRPARPAGTLFTILCVASLEEYKGHRYLLAACALLRDAGCALRCVLVGEGIERAALTDSIEQHGLASTVHLLGRQPREEVARLMGEADVMVLPSVTTSSGKREGLPVALMEALARELPVVATRLSGVPELVIDGETGLLVAERDAEGLSRAIRTLAADPTLARRLGAAGRRHVLRLFDLHQNVTALAELFARDWSDAAIAETRGAAAREVGR